MINFEVEKISNQLKSGMINEKELIQLIDIKQLKVALDVYENEAKSTDNKFN